MHVPEIHEQRKKISGLKMPRRYSPRLPGASTKGQVPVNPFQGNKMKVASLAQVRETQLLKTASYDEQYVYAEMCKLAESHDYDSIRLFLAQNPELEKEGGIVGHGFRMLSKALGGAGKLTGSSRLTQYAGRAAKASSKRYAAASEAIAKGATPSTMKGLDKAIARQDYLANLAKAQRQQAKDLGRLANQQGKTPGQILSEGMRKAKPGGAAKPPAAAAKPPAGAAKPPAAAGGTTTAAKPPAAGTPAAGTPASGTTAATPPKGGGTPSTPTTAGGEAAASPLISNSTLGKALVGGAVVGGTGLAGYGAYKGYQRGQQQNLQASQTGFNYGM